MGRIKGSTQLTCIIGSPVDHSKSPYMHNLAFEKLGLDYAYMAFDIKEGFLKQGVDGLRTLNVRGFNITMPHKQEVMKYLDKIEEDAKLIGAVNTVLNDNGKLIGYNTDGKGFIKSLEERDVKYIDEKIVLIGAGGAAKAIAIELALKGVKNIVIVNRTLEKAEAISNTINKNIQGSESRSLVLDEKLLKEELKDANILINTTSIGMGDTIDNNIINDRDILHKDLFVADLIYNPVKTKFLSMAEEKGCRIMNGLAMLVYQGALVFKIWTGTDMPVEVMKEMEKRNLIE